MFRDVLTQLMSEACLFFGAEFFTRKQYLTALPPKAAELETSVDVSKVHKTEIKTSVAVALVQCLCNLFHQFAFGIGLLKYSRFAEIL
jgi:hypothetical protein